ncbi:galactose oxidase [Irpex lacteus]|nr:galactose oxidase [Irpex lacteus]
MRRDWEDAHKVTEELVEGPPSRRANATFTPCPVGNYLWCIGGEFFSEDGQAHFYNDVFRYTPEKDEWRKYVSQTCPGPRSAHAVVASPAGGGKLFLFGGEFSSLHQTTFHHYRDFWCFDITTHTWDRIETKIRPTARSGHRMAMWKHYVILFGGFYDPGFKTNYLNDLWIFDTQEYKWKQIEFKTNERQPSPRSGFSFLPTPDGILLHGGYCKEYHKGKRPIGVMLEDTWFLRMSMPTAKEDDLKSRSASNFPTVIWERRKRPSTAFAPSLRSGCTMALWANKNTGILFGGVTDEDNDEESLESVFHNDLYGYQIAGNGRWVSLTLKMPKQKGGGKKKKKSAVPVKVIEKDSPDSPDEGHDDSGESDDEPKPWEVARANAKLAQSPNPNKLAPTADDEADLDDPNSTRPLPRYNAMLAVLKNTLYIYGGIFERGKLEYTLDDYYSLQLDKLDKYVCLKPSDVDITAGGDESSSDDDDDSNTDEEEDEDMEDTESDDGIGKPANSKKSAPVEVDEEMTVLKQQLQESTIEDDRKQLPEESEIRAKATAFMGVSKDSSRSSEDVMSTPLPGETLAKFYARSKEHWVKKAFSTTDDRGKEKGKMLRQLAFEMAKERYNEYKPILKEVEKILEEAGLDEEEIKRSAAAGPMKASDQSRNRR